MLRLVLACAALMQFSVCFAQLTVKDIVDFSDLSTFEDFDNRIRSLGFAFKAKDLPPVGGNQPAIYRYTKGTSSIAYMDYSDQRPVIEYSTSPSDMVTPARAYAETHGYVSEACPNSDEKNTTLSFCWKTSERRIKVIDMDSGVEGYRIHTLKVFKVN